MPNTKNSYYVHPKAIVETKDIGDNTRIWAFVHILAGAKIGKNANICDHCFIENEVILGDNVTIKSGVYLWDGIHIHDAVFIGPSATFTNDLRPRSKNLHYEKKETVIHKGATIGANATILSGIEIGEYAFVGAGTVVTKSIPKHVLVYGNPMVMKGYVCVCGNKLKTSEKIIRCSHCGIQYKFDSDELFEIHEQP